MPTINIKSNGRLAGLIVLSALLHVCGFYLLNNDPQPLPYQPTITAQIVYPSSNNNRVAKPLNKQIKTPASQSKQAITKQTSEPDSTIADNQSADAATSNKPAEAINWYQVKSRVKSEFKQYFYYPKLAIRNGWQGRVLLSLTISQAGIVSEHRIIETSGYSVLDQAALSSLAKIKHIKLTPQRENYVPVSIEFPVIFKLSKG